MPATSSSTCAAADRHARIEARLPPQPRGYYREYTVPTRGADDRGPRRIVTGGNPAHEYWYSDDHYRRFRRFDVGEGAAR